ncbi:hypothetical protein L1787_00705 [Acuticoccus sp. M5D2P5]|uniref:hypothetical protein n=1 Tax=Acuticoccus kalidii TaxID=2910977 RepID=UPI001F321DA1|nr:hypothetical protein [Acuticoccus kalidii]MCF3931930.1 hypothetical protein [Acuticoccus kalidii]
MIRSITLAASILVLSLAGAGAEETLPKSIMEAPTETQASEPGVESIAQEAAEVGEEGTEAGGMERTEDEMIEAEDNDGCVTNEDTGGCPGEFN